MGLDAHEMQIRESKHMWRVDPPSVLSPLPETIIEPKESGGNRQLEKDEKETLNRRMIYFILEAFGYPSDDILFVLRFDEQNAFLTK